MQSSRRKILFLLFTKLAELQSKKEARRSLALEIQEEIIARVTRAESSIRAQRRRISAGKSSLSVAGKSRAQAQAIKNEIQRAEHTAEAHKLFIEILKTIGDSIAFIYADRFDLKPFAFKQSSGFLSGKKGARLERKILRKAFEWGAVAVLNDITHTLRYADITVFRPDGKFFLIEAKSGRGGDRSRQKRQQAAAETMASYLETDQRLDGDQEWCRVGTVTELEDHAASVRKLVRCISKVGSCVEEVEPGLYYVLIDCAADVVDFKSLFGQFSGRKMMLLPVNELKHARLGYQPFPVTFHDPEITTRFFSGDFVMNVLLDLDAVNRALAAQALMVVPMDDEIMCWQVVETSSDSPLGLRGRKLLVSRHAIGRLAAEFIRLDWLLANMIASHVTDYVDAFPPTNATSA